MSEEKKEALKRMAMEIKNPPKSWWEGDKRVEPYMEKVGATIGKYLKWPSPEYTDVYNRCYEAVYQAIVDADKTRNVRSK